VVEGAGEDQVADDRVARFPEGLVFKAHRLVYHSTLGWRVIKQKGRWGGAGALGAPASYRKKV